MVLLTFKVSQCGTLLLNYNTKDMNLFQGIRRKSVSFFHAVIKNTLQTGISRREGVFPLRVVEKPILVRKAAGRANEKRSVKRYVSILQ